MILFIMIFYYINYIYYTILTMSGYTFSFDFNIDIDDKKELNKFISNDMENITKNCKKTIVSFEKKKNKTKNESTNNEYPVNNSVFKFV